MLQGHQSKPNRSNRSLINELHAQIYPMAQDEMGVFQVASRLNVTPTTVKKILAGRAVSYYVQSKVNAALQHGLIANNPTEGSEIHRLLHVHRLYQKNGTLRSVGEQLGLSRERVRQLLAMGAKIGLFTYQPVKKKLPSISRKKILNDYKKSLTLNGVAVENNISLAHLKRLRMDYHIDKKELTALRIAHQRRDCLTMYRKIVKTLGYHPTTTELQQLKGGRYLQTKIRRVWGSFHLFRQFQKGTATPLKVRFQFKGRFKSNARKVNVRRKISVTVQGLN